MSLNKTDSPRIVSCEWGVVRVENQTNRFKDVMLYPGGAKEWDWNVSGTHHEPGILIADLQFLREQGAQVMVLSQGFYDRLQLSDDARRWLEKEAIPYQRANTARAVEIYNRLCAEKPAGALIHSTC